MVLFALALLILAGVIWYFIPAHFLSNVPAGEIAYIDIFSGSNGINHKITDKNVITHILNNIQGASFYKKGFSLGNMGYRYRISFYNEKDNVIECFIINSTDTIRKDPFFYHDNASSIDVDYIENLLSDETIIIYEKAHNSNDEH